MSALSITEVVEGFYRTESRHVLATLIRLLGDFDLAEDALQEAFAAAAAQRPQEGVPANQGASWRSVPGFSLLGIEIPTLKSLMLR